jgi:hypothetical protein
MLVNEGQHILYAECVSDDDLIWLANIKYHAGWEFVCKPFPSRYGMVDSGEETTLAVPTVWTLIMHRKEVAPADAE